jgi:hypothetical protein
LNELSNSNTVVAKRDGNENREGAGEGRKKDKEQRKE